MEIKIWNHFTQILTYRPDLAYIIKPFFENLNNKNINDEKYLSFLKSFSKFQLQLLLKTGIISSNKLNSLEPNKQVLSQMIFNDSLEADEKREKKSIQEIYDKRIEEDQYFKIMINNNNDIRKAMDEQNPEIFSELITQQNPENKTFEWDSMAIAIFLGNNKIVRILKEKGIEIENYPPHIEAAILSYRNAFASEIIGTIKVLNKEFLNKSILSSAKNNNIKGGQLLIENGANINAKDSNLNYSYKIKQHFIMRQRIILKR